MKRALEASDNKNERGEVSVIINLTSGFPLLSLFLVLF